MKKILTILVLSVVCVLCAIGFAACDGTDNADTRNPQILGVYNTYVAYAEENGITPLSYDEWLESIKGENGKDGKDGINGIDGKDGVSIVKIEKTFTDNLIDTYTITYSNGETTTFTVNNGVDGRDGTNGVDGKDGKDGINGQDGITPQVRINADTNEWAVSYDKGATWTGLGIKATGTNGVGIKNVAINESGDLIITLTDDTPINAGKIKDVHPHEITEKEIVEREPTCATTGLKYVVCETCNELIRTVITEKLPHTYSDVITPPTCTGQGYTTHTCKDCGYIEVDNYTEPTGHSYVEEFSFDDNYHWQETTCGHKDAIIKQAHILNENEICTVCGYDSKATLALSFVKIDGKEEYALDELTDETVKTVYIPETYNGLPITKINEMVFYGNTTIEKVIMGDNITDMGVNVFYGCSHLTTVKLSGSLKEIKDYAFSYCSNLMSVTIGNSVISIGKHAFSWCEGLRNITIPKSLTSTGEEPFLNCNGLKDIYYTGTVAEWTQINRYGIWLSYDNVTLYINNEPLKNAILDNITEIKPYAFYNCSSLESVIISDSVTSIGRYAFIGCPCVKTSKGVSYVDKWLISCINAVTSAVIKEDTVGIADYAFLGCNSLTSITIPDSVTSIGDYAFYNCSSLTSITIPDSVTSIGDYAFYNCGSLRKVYYTGTAEEWKTISIDYSKNILTNAMRYYYSETEPELNGQGTAYNGNYWHYVDGEIVVWTKEN